jgi:hypothetical protein
MRWPAVARCLLLLLAGVAVAQAATVVKTNRNGDEDMPAVPVNEEDKPTSGFYEPFGQAPIAVAHSLQLPCGNKFLMMVRERGGPCLRGIDTCRMLQTADTD